MFENLSILALQQYWWVIISILGAALVFLFFVQGGQTLLYTLAKNEDERTILVNTFGRKWEYTFTTLVTFGGAFFASFPLFYSTSFGGAFWVWILILFAFVLQAVSYEFRSKPNNFLGKKSFEVFLFINGALGTILTGAAVSTFFTGSLFSVNQSNLTLLTGNQMPTISRWETPFHGLEAALNVQNLCLGLAVFFLARVLAILYIQLNVDEEKIIQRTRKGLITNALPFLVFFLTFLTLLLLKDGFAYNAQKQVFMEPYKYLHNLLEMPLVLILFLSGVVLVLLGIIRSYFLQSKSGIWASGIGTFLTVFSLFLVAGFNHTSFYPSTFDLQSSLTIENASSSKYTLVAMSYVSLFVPVVLLYIIFVWRKMNAKKLTQAEINQESHAY